MAFVLMLVLLHLAAMRGAEDFWARGLMLAHFGLFIMWQPFMRAEQRLNALQIGFIVLFSGGIMLFLSWWMLALWVSALAGIVGGKVFLFQALWLRRFYLIVLFYLVVLLLAWIVPNSFSFAELPEEVALAAQYGLTVLFVVMLFLPVEAESAETPQIVDFLYAALLFLLLVVLVLGSIAFMAIGEIPYSIAVSYTLLLIGGGLLLLSVAWNPRSGFSGLALYFSRYLLSVGLPFEKWLYFLADLSKLEAAPDQFLEKACNGLSRLPWVSGGEWQTKGESGKFGTVSKHTVEFDSEELRLQVFGRHALSPSLVWHFQLLGQLLAEYYVAKLREQKLQQQSYMQAVYETGARVTHDVKNLLQSLNGLCSAAEQSESADKDELSALMRRQLPVITQRLQQTLDKLQHPPQSASGQLVSAREWWDGLCKSYQNSRIDFSIVGIEPSTVLPKELFDSAADNLLQNALRKRLTEKGISIRATLQCADRLALTVHDSGNQVPGHVVHGLLRGPVASESGFGIGLYQVSRLAKMSGFSLALSTNDPANVRFTLIASEQGGTGAG
ncbi:MAG: HAMP domain-containing histidine kinase [Betaproteobacteria bacterium]|nr:HAMP domain-containing histidine kinase [Betaproteobacteria bacterium]